MARLTKRMDILDSPCTAAFLCIGYLLLSLTSGTTVQMLTKPRVSVVNPGDRWYLDCEFYAEEFNLFDNPILWRKTQASEDTQVNMMGNLLEPFESTRRFKVSFVPRSRRYTLGLTIAGVTFEDSGNYTCEVNGPQNSQLAAVTHYVFVRAPIVSVLISSDNDSPASLPSNRFAPRAGAEDSVEQQEQAEHELVFVEHIPIALRCVVRGGYPPPDVTVHIGQRDVTNEFHVSHRIHVDGVRSLRVMRYITTRWTHHFHPRAADDATKMTCRAVVAGLAPNVTSAKVTVHFAPVITCHPKYASLDERNTFLRCELRARPEVGAIFWIIDNNGTTVSEGDVINEYWTLVTDRRDGSADTQLFLRQTRPESFRRYTLVAENSVGVRTSDVSLMQKYSTTIRPQTVKAKLANEDASNSQQLPPRHLPNGVSARQANSLASRRLCGHSARNILVAFVTLLTVSDTVQSTFRQLR